MTSPLVSVVIPTYNRVRYVTKAVESVLNQAFTDYEIIVVDDGSMDDTKNILDQYRDKLRYIYQHNSGVSIARNTGISISNGRWIAFLDSDDEWHPEYLQQQIIHTMYQHNLSMQSTDCNIIEDHGVSQTYFDLNGAGQNLGQRGYLLIDKPFSFVVEHSPWQVGSTIFLRDAIAKAGSFDPSLTVSEDFDLMARVSRLGSFGLINRPLVDVYRRKESTENLSSQFQKDLIKFKLMEAEIYQKLLRARDLSGAERRLLRRIVGSRIRTIGNLLLQVGKPEDATEYFRRAFLTDLSARSLGKYILSRLSRSKST